MSAARPPEGARTAGEAEGTPVTAYLRPHSDNLALLQAHCAALAGDASASASHCAGQAAAQAQRTAAFLATLAWHRADLEHDIFPALFTSMAGSDAVCIREMRERLATQLDALVAQWRRLQELLGATTAIAAAPAHLPAEGEALCALCRGIVDFETRELLPMAERLLDDATLAQLGAAMGARRAAATGRPGAWP